MTAAGDLARHLATRSPQVVREPLDGKPFDLFVAVIGPHRWVGRKAPARHDPDRAERAKGCLVEAGMLLGLMERDQLTADGVSVHHRPLAPDEKEVVFAALADSPENDLYYPYARLTAGLVEPITDPGYWTATPERVRELDAGEAPLRLHARHALVRHGVSPGVVYDPACSTGAFLATLKETFPHCLTVGQDADATMVEHAGERVDRAALGDSIVPVLPPASADLVLCRHLNVTVVTARRAAELFESAAATCRPGGWAIVTGHTPVLLAAEHFEAAGFEVVERSGATPSGHAIFQFYLLNKQFSQRA